MNIPPYVFNALAIILTVVGFIITNRKNRIDSKKSIADSEQKLRERIVAIEVKIDVFWKNVAFDSAKILHTPHPENARRDELLELFVEGMISRDQLRELIILLKTIIEDKVREFGERTAASNLLRAIEIQYDV